MICTSVVGDRERPLHQRAQRLRHPLFDLEPDHQAAPALLQRTLEEAHEVFRFFLDLDVGVADQPEGSLAAHLVAGEEPRDEQPDRVFEEHEAERVASSALRGTLDEAVEAERKAQQRLHRPCPSCRRAAAPA